MSLIFGSQLDDHGRARHLLHPFGDHAGVFRHLTDRTAHAPLVHSVRTAEVKFEAVGSGILGHSHHLAPGLALRFNHERGDDGIAGVTLLDLGNFSEICFDRAIRDELDVIEAHHAIAVPVNGRVAGTDVNDRLADGLPDRPSPAGVERAHHLVGAIRWRTGGKPKGIRAADPAREVDVQVSHERSPVRAWRLFRARRVCRQRRHRRLHDRRSRSRRPRSTSNSKCAPLGDR